MTFLALRNASPYASAQYLRHRHRLRVPDLKRDVVK